MRLTYVSRGPEFSRANGDTTIKLPIKLVPASSRNCIAGWLGETLKVRVTAPAERGEAHATVEMIIAEALGVSRKCARVITGKTSPRKVVEIVGLSESEVYRRLSKGACSVSTRKSKVMKLTSPLPEHLAFLVRINIYLLIIFIAYSLLSVWSHAASPMIGAATMVLLVPACLLLLILHFVAYFTNSAILYTLLTIIYVYFTVSSLSSLISGDIEGEYFAGGIFLFYLVAYSLIFAYSSRFTYRLKGESRGQ